MKASGARLATAPISRPPALAPSAASRSGDVQPGDYPAILADTSLNDTRVLFVEPAKWVARLRTRVTSPEQVLLKTEMSAGHGGVSGRYNAWRDRAFSYAWVLDQVGLEG